MTLEEKFFKKIRRRLAKKTKNLAKESKGITLEALFAAPYNPKEKMIEKCFQGLNERIFLNEANKKPINP